MNGRNIYLRQRDTLPHSMHCKQSCDTIDIDRHCRCRPTVLVCNYRKNVRVPSNMRRNVNQGNARSYLVANASMSHHANHLRHSVETAYLPSTRELSTNHMDWCHSCKWEISPLPIRWQTVMIEQCPIPDQLFVEQNYRMFYRWKCRFNILHKIVNPQKL